MKLSFMTLLDTVTRGARTLSVVVAVGFLIKKEERQNLSVLDKIRLAKSTRKGGKGKFTFFESDGQPGGGTFTRPKIFLCAVTPCPNLSCTLTWMMCSR